MLELYNHQKRLLAKNLPRCLIAHSVGTGKTVSSLALAEQNKVNCLIIVPKALRESWGRSVALFSGNNHRIISKEEFRRDWDILPRYNGLIIDEFHFFGNLKSQMSKSLIKYQKKYKPTFIWGLTATPYCSSAMNIYALASHLGYKWNYWEFFNKFFYKIPMGGRSIPVQKKGIEKELAQLVKSIGDTCTLESCVDVPEQVFETIYFEKTKKQERAINKIEDTIPIVRWTATHSILQGVKNGDDYTQDEFFDCLKNDYIASLSEENPKMVVVCRYNLQIELLKNILEGKKKKVFIINGQVKNRDEVVQEIEKTEECIVLLQADCGIGFEIPSVPLMVFASLSFSFVAHEQCKGRILRINKLKKNVYQYLIIKDSIDEEVYNCVMAKQDFSIAIYNKGIV